MLQTIFDINYPLFLKPYHPLTQLEEDREYILVHPRHWKTNILVNTLDNLKRLWEYVQYELRKRFNSIKLIKQFLSPSMALDKPFGIISSKIIMECYLYLCVEPFVLPC